jgi:hypothetical protein
LLQRPLNSPCQNAEFTTSVPGDRRGSGGTKSILEEPLYHPLHGSCPLKYSGSSLLGLRSIPQATVGGRVGLLWLELWDFTTVCRVSPMTTRCRVGEKRPTLILRFLFVLELLDCSELNALIYTLAANGFPSFSHSFIIMQV